MLKSVASLLKTASAGITFTTDITTEITSLNTFNTVENSTVQDNNNSVPKETAANDIPLIHLVRQQRQQKLEETVLIRKIAHQSLMHHHEQDNLPLSHVKEKLKGDDTPLVQVQQQLEQENDDVVIYTATKENLKSLFYNQRMSNSFLTKPRISRYTTPTSVITNNNTSNNSTISNSTANNDDDDNENYDVWDDAVIGRIMNLVDTIGVDPTKGTIQEAENKNSTTSDNTFENVAAKNGSKDNSKEEPMVFTNTRENSQIESIAEGFINFNDSDNLKLSSNESAEEKDNTVSTVIIETTLQKRGSDNLLRDSGYGEKSTSMVDNNNKRGGRFFGKRRSIPFFSSNEISSSQEDSSVIQSNITLRRNSHLSRKGSIHSRSSRQSSVSSKFSVKTTATGVIMEGDDDPKFRNKFFTTSKSTSRKSNKSLNFLRKLWKANHQDLSSNEILEQYYQQNGNDNQVENFSDRELKSQQSNNIQVERYATNTVGTNSRQTNPDYSNFYLAMPNGQWMVRTRTASRKITGTQYVDQERI